MKSETWVLLAGLVPVLLARAPEASPLTFGSGRFGLEIEGSLEGRYVQRIESSSPREHPQGALRLRAGSDLTDWIRLETAVTGLAGGPPRNPAGAGVFDLDRTLQDLSPSLELEEATLDFFFADADVRAGVQKFAWGKLDALQPNDLLNPESFHDPVLEDENDRKVGIPALSGTYYLPSLSGRIVPESLRFTAVWAPIVTPFHFPDEDERWYPPLARVPPESEVDGFTVRNEFRVRNGDLPSRNPVHGGGAARLAGYFQGADFSLYYFDGVDTQPALDADARGFVRFDPTNPGCVPFQPACFDVRSEVDVFPVFERIRAIGADAAYAVFGATLRAEAAWVMDRLYPKTIRDVVASQEFAPVDQLLLLTGEEQEVEVTLEPANVRRDAIEWGFGGDTLWDGTFVLVQVNQTAILDNDVDLLVSDTETRFAMTVRRSFLDERLEAELLAAYGMQGVYGLAHPRLTYDLTDFVDVRVGFLLVEGHEESMLGQYKRNDQAYVRIRFSF